MEKDRDSEGRASSACTTAHVPVAAPQTCDPAIALRVPGSGSRSRGAGEDGAGSGATTFDVGWTPCCSERPNDVRLSGGPAAAAHLGNRL